jgi:hypothetical protein
MTTTLTCPRCTLELPAAEFTVDRSRPSGRSAICRHCIREDRRESAQSDEDAALQAQLAAEGITTAAAAYRRGRQEGARAAVRALKDAGRVLPSDQEKAAAIQAEAQAQYVVAVADEVLARIMPPLASDRLPHNAESPGH